MASKEIEITIDEEGQITIETDGWSDMGCIKDTEFLKNALGKETKKVKKDLKTAKAVRTTRVFQ